MFQIIAQFNLFIHFDIQLMITGYISINVVDNV